MKQLLVETKLFTPFLITEGKKSANGNMFVDGILTTVEVKNGNGRYYPREEWQKNIEHYINESVNKNIAFGELDHSEKQVIEMKNVSHIIRKVWWDGDNIMGKIEILPTPQGNIVKTLIENNCSVAVSSRGVGNLEKKGDVEEVSDFSLLCWDIVSNPSNPGSYLKETTLNEGLKLDKEEYKYSRVENIIKEILCHNGCCSIK